jgi:hypothetical protein
VVDALAALDVMNAIGWDYRRAGISEWRAACPVCGHRCLLLREPERDTLSRDAEMPTVEPICGRGCPAAAVEEMLRGFAAFEERRNPQPTPRRHRPSFPDRSALDEIPATEYVPVLTGEEARFGSIRCPFHEDDTPSMKLYPDDRGWHCFGCGKGGSIVDFGAERYGITPRGRGFHEIRERLAQELGVAA